MFWYEGETSLNFLFLNDHSNIKAGCLKGEQKPVAAMVCNFTKPTETKPSLLTHREVETFFHEFGHVMHQVNTKVQYHKFRYTII